MNVNWDAVVGVALFLGGTWFAGGPKWAGIMGMIFGLLYLARAVSAPKDGDADS